LRGRIVSEKAAENSSFWTFFNSSVTASWISATGVLLTSFSTWGTKNSLTEINLESTGANKGFHIFWDQKLANNWCFVGGCIIVQQENISRPGCGWTNPFNALQQAIH